MTLQKINGIKEYKRLKESVTSMFESERTGDQDLFREQTKALQPLINTQHQTVKALQDGQTANANALLPLTRELQRRNNQVDLLTEQPFYPQQLPAITPIVPTSPDFLKVDLDAGLNETDKENLQDMSFELPSKVFKNKTIENTLDKIKIENRCIGQKLGKGPPGQKVKEQEKEIYISRRKTLEVYKQKIEGLEGAKQFVSTPKKTGKGTGGVDVIYYSDFDELCNQLAHLNAAKRAGNNGVDNRINSILDELLTKQAIDKDEYDNLYKNIFG